MPETPAEEPGEARPGLSGNGPGAGAAELVARLGPESEPARDRYLEQHPQLLEPAVVERLCAHAVAQLHDDLELARRSAELAGWLAARSGNETSIGLAERARANVLHEAGDYQRAQQSYEQARRRFRRLADARQEAITLSSALHNLIYVGGYQRAHRWYQAAREIYERLDDRLRLARLELNFGNVLHRQDLWEEGMRRYERALEEFLGAGESLDAAICLRNMAMCHINLMNYQQAHDCYRNASELCAEHGWTRLGLINDYNIAYLYYHRADYARAIRLYQECRQKFADSGDEQHRALCDLDLSELYLELNLVEEAARLAQWAYASFDRIPLRYEAAKALANLAVATSRQGRVFKALETFSQARQMFVEEDNRVWPGQVDLYRGILLAGEGRNFEASSLARQAVACFEQAAVPSKAAAADLLLARLALDEDQHERAEQLCRRALERLAEDPAPLLDYEAHLLLATAVEAAGDFDTALDLYREAAARVERLRSHLQIGELKIDLIGNKLLVYESLAALLLGRGGPAAAREAFESIERAKARSLADLMAFRALSLPPKVATPSSLVENIRNLREELNWYYRQIDLHRMSEESRSEGQLGELRQQSERKERQLVRTLGELAGTDREFASLQAGAAIGLDEIQQALPADTAVLEYFFARGAVYAAVLSRQRLDILPVTIVSRVREQQRLLQFQLSRFRLGKEFVQRFRRSIDAETRSHLEALFEELVAPIWPRLIEFEQLQVVPHGFLHHLPLHALYDGSRFMIERFRFTYAPSSGVAHLSRLKAPAAGERALVVAIDAAGGGESGRETAEADAVAAAMPGSQLVTGKSLDVAELAALARGCNRIHLATRGTYRTDNPMFSTLDLGGDQLSLFDIYGLGLEADLVALTGCGTGLDPLSGTDPLLGLTRGLLYAGARSVLLDLWSAPADCSRQLLTGFYRRLGDRAPADALQAAVLELREQLPHPYFWAPWVLIG